MDQSDYLAGWTRFRAPGRLSITAVPSSTDATAEQTELLFQHLCNLYHNSCDHLVDKLKEVIATDPNQLNHAFGKKIFKAIKNCCYPYLYVERESIRAPGPALRSLPPAFQLSMAPIDHFITITNPSHLKSYIKETISELLGHGFEVEAGLSVLPIPAPFAAEFARFDIGVPKDRQSHAEKYSEFIRSYFPMPNIAEIEDSFVDGTYKRRSAATYVNREYQLFNSFFCGLLP